MMKTRFLHIRGSGLAYAMIFMLVMSVMMAVVLRNSQFYRHNAQRNSWYQSAFHVAEAGVEEAAYQLTFSRNTWAGWNVETATHHVLPDTPMIDSNGRTIGYYRVQVDTTSTAEEIDLSSIPWDVQSLFRVRATGGVPDLTSARSERRDLEVTMEAVNIFSVALFSDLDLEMGGTPATDSYNSNNGAYGGINVGQKGDIGTNHNINLVGTVDIGGSAAAVGTVDYGNNCTISGTIQEISSIYLPPVDTAVAAVKASNDNALVTHLRNGNTTNPLGADGQLSVNGGVVTFPGGTPGNPNKYYVSSTKIVGGASILVTGPVEIYTDGSIDLTGCAVENPSGIPANFLIYSCGPSIKLGGTHDFWGAVYAPEAIVAVGGTSQMYGAITAGKIDYQGTGDFHYDEALGDVGIIAYFSPLDWAELFRVDDEG